MRRLVEYTKTLNGLTRYFKDSDYGITLNEFLTIYAIGKGNKNLKEISGYLSKDSSQVHRATMVLLKKDLLTKEFKTYFLTAKGKLLLSTILEGLFRI